MQKNTQLGGTVVVVITKHIRVITNNVITNNKTTRITVVELWTITITFVSAASVANIMFADHVVEPEIDVLIFSFL